MFLFDNHADDSTPRRQMGERDLPDTQRQQSDNLPPYIGDRHRECPERQFSDAGYSERQALG
ncbi:MAG: hypothetical protein EOO27_37640 [Comamonadaceae bacterium]|nr:MAG: hypothetical protein EOO27_37640 [Comamonadaceae bacterium]